MFSGLKKITSSFLAVWLIFFTLLSALHDGHAHDIMPVEQTMCDEHCEKESHRKAGESCHWFTVNRILSDNGSLDDTTSDLHLVYIDKIPIILEIYYSSPEHGIFSTRAPPAPLV